jgi:hypothetical protein
MPRRGSPAFLCTAALALACAGAGTGGVPQEPPETPRAAELAELAALPAPRELLPSGVVAVDRWTLRGPLPESVDQTPVVLDSVWEEPLRDLTTKRPDAVLPTASMRCVAREMAWFHLEHGANPDDQWMTFLLSRCLTTTTSPRVRVLEGQAPASVDDATLVGAWRSGFEQLLSADLADGPWSAGLGFARDGERAVLVLAYAREQVQLESFDATFPPDGRVSVVGRASSPAEEITAVVGLGDLGAAPCIPHPGAHPPAFHFVCEADPSDEWNWVSVALRRAGRVLTEPGAMLVVRDPGEPAGEFRRRFFTSPYEPGPHERLDEAVAAELNRVRARVGLEPFTLSPAQGEVAASLAPHYLAAVQGRAPRGGRSAAEVLDLVVLGLVAGWEVEGVVAHGAFSSARAAGTRDVSRLVSAALQHPSDRLALLDPNAELLAVGAVSEPDAGLAAVFGSYSLFDEGSFHQAAGSLLGRLIGERAARGLPAPGELRGVDTLAMRAADRVRAGEDREQVLNELLAASSQHLMVGVSGFGGEASRLDEISFPEELLTSPSIGVALGVAAHRPADEPRGRWIVFVVIAPLVASY